MADKFLSFTTGNNANDGTTFANRVQDITSGITAARSAAGDRWKFGKTSAPLSLATNITLTNKDDDATLAAAKTLNIDLCQTAWTASANITTSTSSTRTQGTLSTSFTPAAAFTTGKMAYLTITSLDCSSYEKIALRFRVAGSPSASTYRIDFCSDTTGDTPVHSITIDFAVSSSYWHRIVFDNGAALNNAIQSISLVALTDPGTFQVFIDNIIAANDLHFGTLIGVDSSETSVNWFPIRSIDDTAIVLDMGNKGPNDNTPRGYPFTTTTSTAYVREAYISRTSSQASNEGGSSGNLVTFSGGWDESDSMATQNGLTCILRDTSGFGITLNHTYIKVERLIIFGGASSLYIGVNNCEIGEKVCLINANSSQALSISSGVGGLRISGDITIFASSGDGFGFSNFTDFAATGTIASYSNGTRGGYIQGGSIYNINTLICSNNASGNGGFNLNSFHLVVDNLECKDNAGPGYSGAGNLTARSFTSTGNTGYGLDCNSGSINEVRNFTSSGNGAGGVRALTGAIITLDNPSIAEATKVVTDTGNGSRVQISRFGGDPADFRVYEENALILDIVTTPVDGSAPISVRIQPAAGHTSTRPFVFDMRKLAVSDSGTLTSTFRARRSSTNVAAQLVLRKNQCSGITSDQTDTTAAAIDTWEDLTVSGAPGQKVLLDFEIQAYQVSGSGIIYIGNSSHAQA